VPEVGAWKPTAKSLLIMAGEIQTIEFTPQHRSEVHEEANNHSERLTAAT
jgi:hypothetical protein